MSYARIQFEKKKVNRVLQRCKNSRHEDGKKRAARKDEKKLQDQQYAY